MIKLGAKELRTAEPSSQDLLKIKRNPIYIVLDNVLDTYNVGSIFRLADAVAAQKIFLCGETETPPNPKIKKASVETWKWVSWEYCQTAGEAIERVKREERDKKGKEGKIRVVAVEQSPRSVPYDQVRYQFPLAMVVGNETYGVSKEVLEIADTIVEIPMWGVNKSLNVMISLGIVLFKIMEKIPLNPPKF